jgi:6-carboxyhexanoate--CoA ligase
MNEPVYSIRMRAAMGGAHEQGGLHICGAERLVADEDVAAQAMALIERARTQGVDADFIQVTIDRVPPDQIADAPCLPLTLANAQTVAEARRDASSILAAAGVSVVAIDAAFHGLDNGFGTDGCALHGGALIDIRTGERRDTGSAPDCGNAAQSRGHGVRASRFDYAPEYQQCVGETLAKHGLAHFRTREALALATKVMWSGVTAELCWSDDADYAAGYVATAAHGYVRFAQFKPPEAVGGRALFVDSESTPIDVIVERLQRTALWITGPLRIVNSE